MPDISNQFVMVENMKRRWRAIFLLSALFFFAPMAPVWACLCRSLDGKTVLKSHQVVFKGLVVFNAIRPFSKESYLRILVLREIKGNLPVLVAASYKRTGFGYGGSCGTTYDFGEIRYFAGQRLRNKQGRLVSPTLLSLEGSCTKYSLETPKNVAFIEDYSTRLAKLQKRSAPEAFLRKARILLKYRDLPAALRAYDRYLANKPKDQTAWAERAIATFYQGHTEQALNDLHFIIQRAPHNITARRLLAVALVQLDRGEEVDPEHRDFKGLEKTDTQKFGQDINRIFADRDLSNADFSDSELFHVDFSGSNLRNARFNNATSFGCQFKEADLSGSDLSGANLSGADFSGADLSTAYLENTKLNHAIYDCATKWPRWFSLETAGMRLKGGPCN